MDELQNFLDGIKTIQTTLKEWKNNTVLLKDNIELKCPRCNEKLDITEIGGDIEFDEVQLDYGAFCFTCDCFVIVPLRITTKVKIEIFTNHIQIDE